MTVTSIQASTMFEPRAVNTSQAMRLLGYRDRHRIYRLVRDGSLHARHTRNGGYLISMSSIDKYINGGGR